MRLSSKKRKNILRERRRVIEQGISLQWHHGKEITTEHLDLLFSCYRNTIAEHGSYPYLNQKFFETFVQTLPSAVQLLTAQHGGRYIACAFFLRGQNSLFGRYFHHACAGVNQLASAVPVAIRHIPRRILRCPDHHHPVNVLSIGVMFLRMHVCPV